MTHIWNEQGFPASKYRAITHTSGWEWLQWVMAHMSMSHGTYLNEQGFPTYRAITHMGWLRLVGSLKFQVSFAEHCLFYRALLQKRPMILRSLLIVATTYIQNTCAMCATTYIVASWQTCQWVMAHMHYAVESWHTCQWVMAHVSMAHMSMDGYHRDRKCQWVMAHMSMSHGTHAHVNESWHTYEWVMIHICGGCD